MKKNKTNLPFLYNFGARLYLLRRKRGFTQTSLAEKLGYKSSVTISKLESGQTPPNMITLVKIAEVLSIDIHWLVTGTGSLAVKRLRPVAQAHLASQQQHIMNLTAEGAELAIRQSMGEDHRLRLEEIADELQKLRSYFEAVRKSLNEVLDDIGESI